LHSANRFVNISVRFHSTREENGVFSIPLPILLDAEGRVISMDARGAKLGELLQKHVGEKK